MSKQVSLIKLSHLLDNIRYVTTTDKPNGQGNSGAIWPIIINDQTVRTNPLGCTPDAMSLKAADYLDRKGIDRAVAMRFGLVFYALVYGHWGVFPDVVYKLNTLVKATPPLMGTVATLLEQVMSIVPQSEAYK